MMNVAHLCAGVDGGADIAAVRIHRTLLSAGVNSRYYHIGHNSPDSTFTRFHSPITISSRITSRVNAYKSRLLYGSIASTTEAFTDPVGNYLLTFDRLNFPNVDVITFHWIAAFFDLEPFLSTVPPNVKFVWALHDLNPITGGCHYTAGCNKFETTCVKCPQLVNNGIVDRALRNFRIKQQIYEKYLHGRIHIVADSNWVGDMVRASKLLGAEKMSVINYPIETNSFRNIGRDEARKVLGLAEDKFIILFGSGSIDNKRKGMDLLIDAIRNIKDADLLSRLQLVTFGSGEISKYVPGVNVRNFGRVTAHEFLSLLYNAADYFAMPSREEALGQTAMESLCCGTPVIAFATGGLLDTVDESNGVFAEKIDADSLRVAIESASRKKFDRTGISKKASTRYSSNVKAKEYLRVYNDLLSK